MQFGIKANLKLSEFGPLGYIENNKSFVDRNPRTYVSALPIGGKVTAERVEVLEVIRRVSEVKNGSSCAS